MLYDHPCQTQRQKQLYFLIHSPGIISETQWTNQALLIPNILNGLVRGWLYVHCLRLRMYWEIRPTQTFKPFGSGHEKYQTRAIAQECERDGGEKDEDGVFARCWSVGQLLALPESSGQSQGCAAHADLPLPINARGQLIWTLHTVEVNRGSSAQNHRSQFFKCCRCSSFA